MIWKACLRRQIRSSDAASAFGTSIGPLEGPLLAHSSDGGAALKHVEGGDQDLVRDCHGGLLRSYAHLESVELVAQVAAFGLRCRYSCRDQGRFKEGVPLRVPRCFCLPALSWLAGHTPAQAASLCAVRTWSCRH